MIKQMLNDMLAFLEPVWGLYGFSRDPLEGKFSLAQKMAYGKLARSCGRAEGAAVKDRYGSDIRHAAADMGLTIERPKLPVGGGHVIFAQYVEPDRITVFMDCVSRAERIYQETGLAEELGPVDIEGILLAHEVFHSIEYRKRDSIYTQTEKVELWRRPFSNRSRIIALSEIAGMAFASAFYDLPYSAFIFDVLFMYAYNQDAALALYQELVDIGEEAGWRLQVSV